MIPMTYTLNDALIVQFRGDLDAGNIKTVKGDIDFYADLGRDVIIDIEKVNFIDSSGIGAIVFLYKRLVMNKQNLVIVGLKGQPKQLFEMLHLNKTLTCFESMADFMASNNQNLRFVS